MTSSSTTTKLPCTQLGCSYPSQLLLGHTHNNCCDSLRQIQENSVPAAHSVCPCVLQHRIPVNFLTARGPCTADQTYLLGSDPSAFYSPLNRASCGDLKDPNQPWRESPWQFLVQQPHRFPYDSHSFDPHAHPACARFNPIDLAAAGARRKNATRETTSTLKAWLYEHRKNPYPTKGEKIMLAIITKMTLTQVSTWFANARRRLKKENKMTWSPRNRCGERKDSENSSDNETLDNLDIDEEENSEKTNSREVQDDERLDVEVDRDEKDEHIELCELKEHSQEDQNLHVRTKSPWNPENVPRPSKHAANIEDSPVKSLRKWVDGCFHDSPPNQQAATDTPPSTPPATETPNINAHLQRSEEKSEKVYTEVASDVKTERVTAFKPVERRRNSELKDYREFDAALALTTLSSR